MNTIAKTKTVPLYQLLDKSYLSKSMVIVTSRPAAAANLNESVLSKRI